MAFLQYHRMTGKCDTINDMTGKCDIINVGFSEKRGSQEDILH